MSISKYIIKKLGGFTLEEVNNKVDSVKSDCEVFAVNHMNPKVCSPLMELSPLIGADVSGDIISQLRPVFGERGREKSGVCAICNGHVFLPPCFYSSSTNSWGVYLPSFFSFARAIS